METNPNPKLLAELQAELAVAETMNIILANRCKVLDAYVCDFRWPSILGAPEDVKQSRNLAYAAHRENLHSSQLLAQAIALLECNYDGEPEQ